MPPIPSSTLAAYHETDYCVFMESPFILRTGTASGPLVALYRRLKTDCAAFVTAYNPYSRQTGDVTNAARQAELKAELEQRGMKFFEGEGKHPAGNWPAEPSFLVLGLDLESAQELGKRYEQNAIVWCDEDAVPQLILLR